MSLPNQQQGTFGLAAAIERDDYDDLMVKNGEYISRVMVSQGDILDSISDMVDALSYEMQRSAASAADLVDKLSSLDNLIDEEKRKWIIKVWHIERLILAAWRIQLILPNVSSQIYQQNETEKTAELISRSRNLISSPSKWLNAE